MSTDISKAVERLNVEPGMTVTIVDSPSPLPGVPSYAIRKWDNHGLEPGTHRLIPLCLAEREVSGLLTALSAKSAELEKAREALERISNSYLIEYRSRWISNIARQALGETNG